jgi:hypothetical protein
VVDGCVAQVCGVANIHRVEDLLHWQQGNSQGEFDSVSQFISTEFIIITIGSLRRSGTPYQSC